MGPLSNTFSEIEKKVLLFVENYIKENKKLRVSKQMRQKMKQFNEEVKKYGNKPYSGTYSNL